MLIDHTETMYNIYFIIIIAFFIADFAWNQILSYLNRSQMSPDIPSALAGIYSKTEYARQQDYQRENDKFRMLFRWISFGVMLAVLIFGVLGWLDEWLRACVTENFLLLPLIFFGVIALVNFLLNLPFGIYDTFVIEEKFGFNKSTPKLFAADLGKQMLMGAVIGAVALSAIALCYQYLGPYFWLAVWAVFTGFSVLLSFFYSEWIVPLFNKQTPLPEGELRTSIEDLAKRAGFRLDNIYVMDGSKRTTKANAYFTGFGKKKRIVLFDTLIEKLEPREVTAVLAHEIGHYQKKHIPLGMALSVAQTFLLFWILSLFIGSQPLAEALGGRIQSLELGLVGFSFLYTPLSEILGFLRNLISRRHEYEADLYAAKFGLGIPLMEGLKKISSQALSNLNPHPLVVFWEYSHPTLLQRMARLSAVRGQDRQDIF
ncbi:peptidase M48 [Clostridia bacterium]|nr:peptidase M48 [Clostridia bacterium]